MQMSSLPRVELTETMKYTTAKEKKNIRKHININ